MPSVAELIMDQIEVHINTLLPSYDKSPFVYSLELNNRKTSKQVYSIRPGSALNVQSVTRAITLDQVFEVYLSKAYTNVSQNDLSLQEKVLEIMADHETLYKEVFLRRLAGGEVMIVQGVDLLDPEIDFDNHFVSITASYTVKYRNSITV